MKTLANFGLTPGVVARYVISIAAFATPAIKKKHRADGRRYSTAYRAKFLAAGLTTAGTVRKNKMRPEIGLGRAHPDYRRRYYLLTGDNGARPRNRKS